MSSVIMAGNTAEKSVKQVKKQATIGSFMSRGSTRKSADRSEYAGSLHVSPLPSSSVPLARATSPPPIEPSPVKSATKSPANKKARRRTRKEDRDTKMQPKRMWLSVTHGLARCMMVL